MSDTQAEDQPRLRLFSAHGSSCCQRLWIALAHKKLTYTVVPVDLQNRGNQSQDYRSINSSGRVPTLEVDSGKLSLRNSLTSLLWLEEAFPDRPRLLPSEWSRRAVVLDLVALILADTQPVQNSRVCRRAGELVVGQDGDSASISEHGKRWRAVAVRDGLQAFDSMIGDGVAGRFSVGDEFTLADVVLFCQAYWAKQ